jgi:hypothetical protein
MPDDNTKIWRGAANPCTKDDMYIFYAATSITLGNGRKTPFWAAPWLGGRKPIDVALLIYNISKRKSWKVCDALNGNAWVHKITLDQNFSMDHLLQFVELWSLLLHVHLDDQVEDSISWNLTANGQYSAKSAYEVQFLGSTLSIMHKTVWKVWATPKEKFFAWLFLQNRIWTADRLQKRGWPNCGVCPLASNLWSRCTISLWSVDSPLGFGSR